jgi:hypothetical protein
MEQILKNDSRNDKSYTEAIKFANHIFGTPDALSKKLADVVVNNLSVEGEISRSDFNLFCFHILSHLVKTMSLTELILTKNEENNQV